MNNKLNIILVVVAGLLLLALILPQFSQKPEPEPQAVSPERVLRFGTDAIKPTAIKADTEYFLFRSSASLDQTARMGQNLEITHQAYNEFFVRMTPRFRRSAKYKVILYGTAEEFRANSPAPDWAESYYKPPYSYGYYASEGTCCDGMMRAVVMQLNQEWTGFRTATWLDEGIARYFSTSKIESREMKLGEPDPSAYPVRELANIKLTGKMRADIAADRIFPLQNVVSSDAELFSESMRSMVDLHYWSLSHFLIHGEDGKYASAYRKLFTEGSTVEDFELIIGPLEEIEPLWYAHLQKLQAQLVTE